MLVQESELESWQKQQSRHISVQLGPGSLVAVGYEMSCNYHLDLEPCRSLHFCSSLRTIKIVKEQEGLMSAFSSLLHGANMAISIRPSQDIVLPAVPMNLLFTFAYLLTPEAEYY